MRLLTSQRKVNYFGAEFMIPNEETWIATDKNGDTFMYDSAPIKHERIWGRRDSERDMAYRIGRFELFDTHFSETLRRYPAVKPRRLNTQYRQVKFFGIDLFTPIHGWLAMNKNGKVYWHESEPLSNDSGLWTSLSNSICIAELDLPGTHWTKTKKKV